jgi:hypothetical protein
MYRRKMTEGHLDIVMYRLTQYGDNELTKLVINHLRNGPQPIIEEISEVITLEGDDEIFEYMLDAISYEPHHLDNLLEHVVLTYLELRDENVESDEYLRRIYRLKDLGGNIDSILTGDGLIRRHLQFMVDLGYTRVYEEDNILLESLIDDGDCVDIAEIHQLLNAGVCKYQILNKLGLS